MTLRDLSFVAGFTDPVTTGCCGFGPFNGVDGGCRTISNLCTDRTKSIFWDAFHPTEAVNIIANKIFLDGPVSLVSPINVRQLMRL